VSHDLDTPSPAFIDCSEGDGDFYKNGWEVKALIAKKLKLDYGDFDLVWRMSKRKLDDEKSFSYYESQKGIELGI